MSVTALCRTLSIGVILGAAVHAPVDRPQPVRIDSGVIEGFMTDATEGIVAFLGVPYAAAPTGERRWKPPQPPARWSDVRSARAIGPPCPQPRDRFPSFQRKTIAALGGDPSVVPLLGPTDEDCLSLNVWTSHLGEAATQPVMVWVHGGGFRAGQGGIEAAALARHGVVVVTLNYRVGAAGFLAHPALTRESPSRSSGNYGFHDIVEALRWVRRNIGVFGGDPDRVVLFGHSAGAVAVLQLMSSPVARGLFARAIAQSPGLAHLPPLAAGEAVGERFAARMGAPAADPLPALRMARIEELVAATDDVPLGPVADGTIVPAAPLDRSAAGERDEVPLVIGATQDEFANIALVFPHLIPGDRAAYRALLEHTNGAAADRLATTYPISRDEDVRAAALRFLTDRDFICASRSIADARVGATWLYLLSTPAASTPQAVRFGAYHGADLRLLFGQSFGVPLGETGERVGTLLRRYWARFAATGDPNGPELENWPRYSKDDPWHMAFGTSARAASARDHRPCALLTN